METMEEPKQKEKFPKSRQFFNKKRIIILSDEKETIS